MLIVRFQPFSAVIGDSCALLMDAHRASPRASAGAIAASVSQQHSDFGDYHPPNVDEETVQHAHGEVAAAPFRPDTITAGVSEEEDDRAHAIITNEIAVEDFPLRALECILDEATVRGAEGTAGRKGGWGGVVELRNLYDIYCSRSFCLKMVLTCAYGSVRSFNALFGSGVR